jgi:tRNA A-37 threonylcarbamoyl transferase component Bud32
MWRQILSVLDERSIMKVHTRWDYPLHLLEKILKEVDVSDTRKLIAKMHEAGIDNPDLVLFVAEQLGMLVPKKVEVKKVEVSDTQFMPGAVY